MPYGRVRSIIIISRHYDIMANSHACDGYVLRVYIKPWEICDTWLHDSSAYTHAYFAHIDHIKTSLSTLYKLGVYLDKHQEV